MLALSVARYQVEVLLSSRELEREGDCVLFVTGPSHHSVVLDCPLLYCCRTEIYSTFNGSSLWGKKAKSYV